MAATGASAMPLPTDYVTNERVENILLGIAQQIEGAMTTVKSEMTGLITEAELRWQTRLAEQTEASERDRGQAPPDGLEAVRAPLAESETQTSELLRAQNAELQQLQTRPARTGATGPTHYDGRDSTA